MGFISNNSKEIPSTNCMMFSCRDKCVVVDRPTAAEGVISVIINRTAPVSLFWNILKWLIILLLFKLILLVLNGFQPGGAIKE